MTKPSRLKLKFGAPLLAATCILWTAGLAHAQPSAGAPATTTTTTTTTTQKAPAQPESAARRFGNEAVGIASQPARDVGMSRREIPPAVLKASQDPYGLTGLKTCKQLASALGELNQELGPDFQRGSIYHENRMAKLAEAGGKTVVNSFIPFRGLVREVTGAAPADRKLSAAVDAGYARRGFLRGVYTTRNCRPRL